MEARKALLVEDNEINAEIAKLQLADMGFDVDWVENGARAVESYGDSPEGYYSLIIMDLMMPVMDGIEATGIIRNLGRNDSGSIPIIAVTANVFPADREMAIQNGVTSFITKPYSRHMLQETIEGLVG